jgi:hypothetical protein
MKIYSPTTEERAFLYQEAQSLEPLLRDLGSLTVLVEEVPHKKTDDEYRVTFVVAPETGGMRIHATDKNIYDATIAAKVEAERQLNAILNSLPRSQLQAGQVHIPTEFLH